jgi:NADH:ubiquinone oxidoreductase subunit 4 (subunit M)
MPAARLTSLSFQWEQLIIKSVTNGTVIALKVFVTVTVKMAFVPLHKRPCCCIIDDPHWIALRS